MRRMRVCALLFGLLLVLGACESDGGGSDSAAGNADTAGGNGGQTDPGAQPAENCQERCTTKASDCGAPTAIAGTLCGEVCGLDPTESQAQCLETTSCAALEAAMVGGALPCDIGEDSGGNGNGNGGGSCEGDAPYCDGDDLVTCVEIAGQPAEQRETCPAGCSDARCQHYSELCDPGFEGSSGCNRDECNMSDVVIVDGVRFCTSSCGPDDTCPSGTECFPSGSQDICLPACTPGARGECPDGFLDVECGDSGACGLL